MKHSTFLFALAVSALSAPAWPALPDTEAVEYYNVGINHYFITAMASEVAIIESGGAGPGWVRTGRSFQAWLKREEAPADAQAVCRFYSPIANSHFYTASAGECAGLRSENTGWQYEGVGFYVQTPQEGRCAAGNVAIQRLYNSGLARAEGSNHRFVDDPALAQLMTDSGWMLEGTAFCAAAKATGTNANLRGTTLDFGSLAGTWSGNGQWEVKTASAESKSPGMLELKATADGVLEGTGKGCTIAGDVETGDGFRSLFMGTATAAGCADAAFDGEYDVKLERYGRGVLKAKLVRESAEGRTSIEAVLHLGFEPPVGAPLRMAEGEWAGTVSWSAETPEATVQANKLLELAVSSTGAVTGTGFGCTFTGAVGGEIVAAGCEQAVFNGAYRLKLQPEGRNRLEITLERESADAEVEISGVLLSTDGGPGGAPGADEDPIVIGSWSGPLAWRAGAASGTGTLAFTVDAAGAFSGTGAGCTFTGSLVLADEGRTVSSGSITAAGCTEPALDGTFTHVEIEGEDDGLEIELERGGGARVKLKAKVARTA